MLTDVLHAFQVVGQTAFGFCIIALFMLILFVLCDVAADEIVVRWRRRQWRRLRTQYSIRKVTP